MRLGSIHVPEGFTVEVVAETPTVEHPMWACFDDRGGLFVAESAGLNLKADDLLKNPPSSILLLEDTHGNGTFDKRSIFADKMVFPQGVCWHDGALYVASSPSLWRLRDTHNTGVADERTELVTHFGFTGNAADIHGPVLGPDGRLYWCDGRHGHQIALPDGSTLKGEAAGIFRCRPDGRDVEEICGGGMDNPVQVAFTPLGEPLVSCNIVYSRPARIDGILYALEGAVFPWNTVFHEFKSTGDLFEPVDRLGWVAVAGMTRYRGNAFDPDFRDNLFSAKFNPHRVQRHIVHRDGGGFTISNEDFLTSTDPDFHPTAVVEDADGSLLIIDTGGWFRIGCPNSRIAKPQVTGAIYRIRRKNAAKLDDPWGRKIAWQTTPPDQLAKMLDDPRPFVVNRAIDQLAMRRAEAIPALAKTLTNANSSTARINAIWALCRIDLPEARKVVRNSLLDRNAEIQQVAANVAGLNRDSEATESLLRLFSSDSPATRREAATSLGRIGRAEATGPLLAALKGNSDRFVEHAIIFALIRLKNIPSLNTALRDSDPAVSRGALIALDQIDNSPLTADQVTPLLSSSDPALQRAAMQAMEHHADWADRTRDYFANRLSQPLSNDQRDELIGQLAAISASPAIQKLLADRLNQSNTDSQAPLLLEVISQSTIDPLPATWVEQVRLCLTSSNPAIAHQAVLCAAAHSLTSLDSQMLELAKDASRDQSLRVDALLAISPRLKSLDASLFDLLVSCLRPDEPPLLRSNAAETFGRAHLSDDQVKSLLKVVGSAGPMELPKLLPAFSQHLDDATAKDLFDELNHSPGLASLRAADFSQLFNSNPQMRQLAEPLLKQLEGSSEQHKAHLAELEPLLSGGDAARGKTIFFDLKASCFACHTVNQSGGQVGPDLSKIGSIRSGRDLLESIVYPSASFARGYEPYLVRTKDGETNAGIISRETADAIYLTTGPRQIKRISRDQIADLRPSTVSIMPQGFDELLTHSELADLIAFLQSLH